MPPLLGAVQTRELNCALAPNDVGKTWNLFLRSTDRGEPSGGRGRGGGGGREGLSSKTILSHHKLVSMEEKLSRGIGTPKVQDPPLSCC